MQPAPIRRLLEGRALAGVLAGLVLAPAVLAAQPRPSRPDALRLYAVEGARIVTGPGAVVDNGTIVVEDGLIAAVGSNVPIPPGAWVVDGSGKTVYPGLIDALTTLGHGSEPRAGGGFGGGGGANQSERPHSWGPEDRPGTSSWLTAADDIDGADARFESWREAGFTTVVSTRHEGLIAGQAAVLNLGSFGHPREMVVATPVAMRINLQDRSRTFTGYPGSSMGVLAYLKQFYYDAVHYRDVWADYNDDPSGKRRPEWDISLEPIRMQFAEGWPVLFPANSRADLGRAIRTTSEMGVDLVVYGAQGAYAAADLLAEGGIPALVDLDWPAPAPNGDPDAEPAIEQLRLYDRAPTTPGVLAAAGVKFAFYSGGLDGPAEVLPAVRRAVAQGLSEEDAVRALTLSAAEIFGVDDRLGSIEEGKIANLVVASAGILDEDARVEMVFADGELFELGQEEAEDGDADAADGPDAPDEGPGAEPDAGGGEPRPGPRGRGRARGPAASGPDPSAPPVAMSADKGPYRDDPATLIRNATVLTASRGTLENADVLMRDGKIERVGAGLDAPPGAVVVDATGKFVTPGIIDAHSHMAATSINEGTVNISSMVTIKDVIRPEDVGMYRALAGGVTTINILHGSANPVGGGNAIIKLRWGADAGDLLIDAPKGIKFALGENTKRDRNPDRYPATRMGVQDVIRQAFLEAREYAEEWDAYEDGGRRGVAPRRDLKLEALAEILNGERWVHSHSYRADEILQLLRLAEEFDFRVRTLQHVLEGYKIADEIAAHGAGASTFSDWWAYKVEAYEAIPHNAALMEERGVLVSINSDSGEEIRHLNQEAAKSMKWGGMDEENALRLVTLNPAIQLGIDDRTGSIDEGKDADVVIWEGHPLSMFGKAVQTYVDGKLYFDIDMDRERQAAVRAEKDALLEKHMEGN